MIDDDFPIYRFKINQGVKGTAKLNFQLDINQMAVLASAQIVQDEGEPIVLQSMICRGPNGAIKQDDITKYQKIEDNYQTRDK